MDLKNLAEDLIEIYNKIWAEAFFTEFEQKKTRIRTKIFKQNTM